MNSTCPSRPTCSIRCARPGNVFEAGGDVLARQADGAAEGEGGGGVLGVVLAAQRADPGKADRRQRLAALDFDQRAVMRVNAFGHRLQHGNALHIAGQPVGDGGGDRIIDADHRRFPPAEPVEDARLHLGIVVDGAVAVEMVGRDVQQAGAGCVERRRQVDLVGGIFDDIGEVVGERLERQHRRADIAAHGDAPSGRGDQMRGERRGRRFAVGAGDRDDFCPGAQCAPLAAEQLGVADDFDACRLGALHRPMRLRMRQRHARREHQRGKLAPIRPAQIHRLETRLDGRRPALLAIVPDVAAQPRPPAMPSPSRCRTAPARTPPPSCPRDA